MKSFVKIFAVVSGVMLTFAFALTLVAFFALRNTGFMEVAIRDHHEGVTVNMPVPVLPIHMAASVVGGFPVRVTWSDEEFETLAPIVQDAIAEIDAGPDMTIVALDDGADKVRIHKVNDQLVVRVHDGMDDVRITVPMRTVRKVAWALR